MCCVTAYGEDTVCASSGGMCRCNPQITDAEVKHLLHGSHVELASVHWDSYPDVVSPTSSDECNMWLGSTPDWRCDSSDVSSVPSP
jgi:hypothetical protein